MAKNSHNEPPQDGGNTPENGGEPGAAGPSLVIAEALGEHAEQQGLVQAEGEEEIAFAVRCIEKLGALVIAMDGNIRTAEGQIAVLTTNIAKLETENGVLTTELKGLKRQLASQRGATTKARARIVEMEEAAKPRALGPMAAVFDDEAEAFTVDDLMTGIDGADEVVLAFSDGKAELKGIKPRKVRAEAFRLHRGRLLFTDEPLEVTGPGDAETVTQLVGVALLLDGEQAAWCALPMPINIGSGQTINLAGSVIFG